MTKISNKKRQQIIQSKGIATFPVIALIWIALNTGYMIYTLGCQISHKIQQHKTVSNRYRNKQES